MKHVLTICVMGLVGLLQAAPAAACRDPSRVQRFFHLDEPASDVGDFVAIVRITGTGEADAVPNASREAVIIRSIRGDWAGKTVRINDMGWNSCATYPAVGAWGMLVGEIVSVDGDEIVVGVIRPPLRSEPTLEVDLPTVEMPEPEPRD